MSRSSLRAIVVSSAVLSTACGGSSGGGSDPAPAPEDVASLRTELALAGVTPLPEAPLVSDELFALGQALFFDKVLSGSEDVSCATCHLPDFATGDGRTLSEGVGGIGFGPHRGGGETIPRNSPALFGVHLRQEVLFWDGRVADAGVALALPPGVALSEDMHAAFLPGLEALAAQAMLPPVSREEMRGRPGENPLGDLGDGYNSAGGTPDNTQAVWDELTERLLDLPGYVAMLQAAYPGVEIQDFGFAHVGNAIAAFEARAFHRVDSPLQRFLLGDDQALTKNQVRGGLVFFNAGCARCHSGPLLSDGRFHDTGLPQLGPGVDIDEFVTHSGPDLGRFVVSRDPADVFRFRTPSLHNVELTGPWGHAGQFARLRDFVEHYRDVELSLLNYDIGSNVDDPVLVLTQVPNTTEVLSNLDPLLRDPNPFFVAELVEFLGALTADDARDLADIVPASVPSGLPVF